VRGCVVGVGGVKWRNDDLEISAGAVKTAICAWLSKQALDFGGITIRALCVCCLRAQHKRVVERRTSNVCVVCGWGGEVAHNNKTRHSMLMLH
jgi:hypothetical protein